MSVHPDMTALRAVDACGGIYTPAEEVSGFAAGHRAALASAMVSVGTADGVTSALLAALRRLLAITDCELSDAHEDGCGCVFHEARAAVAKATGSEASA